jgi:hypothetical protein
LPETSYREAVDLGDEHAPGAERRSEHHRAAIAALDGDAYAVGMRFFVECRFVECVREPFVLGDLERRANAIVVGRKPIKPATIALSVPCPSPVRANDPCSSMSARSGVRRRVRARGVRAAGAGGV